MEEQGQQGQESEQRQRAVARAWWERYGGLLQGYCREGEACAACWCGISVRLSPGAGMPRALMCS
jgi:hypothetical protein